MYKRQAHALAGLRQAGQVGGQLHKDAIVPIIKKLNEEQTQLAGEVAGYKERLSALQEDVKILRDVRHLSLIHI